MDLDNNGNVIILPYAFEPKEDITAYEIALMFKTLGIKVDEKTYEAFSAEVARHYKKES